MATARETVRDWMKSQFEKNGTTEFTTGEIARGTGLTNGNVNNGLKALSQANKAIKTRLVPGGMNKASFWALTEVLEKATAPEANDPTPYQWVMTDEEQVEMSQNNGNGDRKPRHDDPDHVMHELEKKLKAFRGDLTAELSRMLGDTEKALKTAISNVKAAEPAPSANADVFNWDKFSATVEAMLKRDRQEMYEDAVKRTNDQNIMSFADIGAKLSEENTGHMLKVISIAQDFVNTFDRSQAMMHGMLAKAVGDDELKEQGFARGFAAGWAASQSQLREALREEVEARLNARGVYVEHGPTGNSLGADIPEQAKPEESKPNDIPLRETLKKLGAF